MKKNRDYPLAPTPYPTEDIKSKKLEVKPISAANPSINNIRIAESKEHKAKSAAIESKIRRKSNRPLSYLAGGLVLAGAAKTVYDELQRQKKVEK